ncbi:MAG: hypothetical protein V1872_06410 [bacterium]
MVKELPVGGVMKANELYYLHRSDHLSLQTPSLHRLQKQDLKNEVSLLFF